MLAQRPVIVADVSVVFLNRPANAKLLQIYLATGYTNFLSHSYIIQTTLIQSMIHKYGGERVSLFNPPINKSCSFRNTKKFNVSF